MAKNECGNGAKTTLNQNLKIDVNEYLSPNFQLKELIVTSHTQYNNLPDIEIYNRLKNLAVNFLQPIRDQFGPIRINSGYRSKEVNTAVKGAKNSAHLYGCAADFVSSSGKKLQDIYNWIIDSKLDYDQVILETSGKSNWIHLGSLRPMDKKPRRENLRFLNGVYTKYDRNVDYGF